MTLINADPESAAGDLYQPENRLSAEKTVWFNAAGAPHPVDLVPDAEVSTLADILYRDLRRSGKKEIQYLHEYQGKSALRVAEPSLDE